MGNIFSDNPTFAVGSIIGLFGILASHRLLVYRERKKQFENAATEFRKAFNQAFVDIKVGDFGMLAPVSDEKIKTQHIAYLNFRPHLRGQYQRRYDEAWNKYYNDCKNLGSLGILTRITRADLEKDIKHLLEFTEYKLLRHISFIFNPIKPLSKEDEKKIKMLSKLYDDIKNHKYPLP